MIINTKCGEYSKKSNNFDFCRMLLLFSYWRPTKIIFLDFEEKYSSGESFLKFSRNFLEKYFRKFLTHNTRYTRKGIQYSWYEPFQMMSGTILN